MSNLNAVSNLNAMSNVNAALQTPMMVKLVLNEN